MTNQENTIKKKSPGSRIFYSNITLAIGALGGLYCIGVLAGSTKLNEAPMHENRQLVTQTEALTNKIKYAEEFIPYMTTQNQNIYSDSIKIFKQEKASIDSIINVNQEKEVQNMYKAMKKPWIYLTE